MRAQRARSGPEGPAAGAKRPHATEGPAAGPKGPHAGPKGPQQAQRASTRDRRDREGERSETVVPEATDKTYEKSGDYTDKNTTHKTDQKPDISQHYLHEFFGAY